MKILTIDTGTTNTRITLWRDGKAVSVAATQVGVRDTAITGSRSKLDEAVRDTIAAALEKGRATVDEVDLVLASGMITSNVGLHEIPHVLAPAGIADLALGMESELLPHIFSKPIWFVPGVRNDVENIGLHNCEEMDMMRGEEVEVMGLIERLSLRGPAMLIMPGSHSKFVCIDESNQITGCVTTLSGELLHIITHNTILADSLDRDFATEINPEMLLAGAELAKRIGLGRACFNVRTLDQFTIYQRNDRANFLLGAVLGADLLTLKNSNAIRMRPGIDVIIAGKPILKQALALLVQNDDYFSGDVTVVPDDLQPQLAGLGAIAVARARKLVTP
ncbi:2-dehydro-3-deoxygalactonokinase [Massilia sp. MB5]|uniref:2-dehydro-3-deoxygalactonokinase n=1 Tax=unclassified Massilia TaxID=2609279 RepID=UPI00067BC50B|nr:MULTISPECIES: 2-dehydro-3-deoxygalactonokinase [unclassified Massilia]AKU23137.1 2-dehydro-3-deoxygalactonokinase [Massilia sp. NR 4-1]UMR31959.1 2-dehydro-3-deoxygalactonokinase [Massilia sp. MB5]